MFCKPQARVLLVSSGTHSTCCCSVPRVTQDSLFAHSKTPLWRSHCTRNTYLTDMHAQLLYHTCSLHDSNAVHQQHVHPCIQCVTDACLLQIAQQSQQAAAACLAALQLSMLPLAGEFASPPPSSALLTSPNAQIPR